MMILIHFESCFD